LSHHLPSNLIYRLPFTISFQNRLFGTALRNLNKKRDNNEEEMVDDNEMVDGGGGGRMRQTR